MKVAAGKTKLHPKNKHRASYDFEALCTFVPELKNHLIKTPDNRDSIDYSNSNSILLLNKALLFQHYNLTFWEIPDGNLCPPIPGRADYVHYLADLIEPKKNAEILDIGTGASCIYPIIGANDYNWDFTASEISVSSLNAAKQILANNKTLTKKVKLRHQKNPNEIFKNIIKPKEFFDACMCNPPFFKDEKQAKMANKRKWKNLKKFKTKTDNKNFGGKTNELIYEGGALNFIISMIKESKQFKEQVKWFTCLVARKSQLSLIEKHLKNVKPKETKIIEMSQGQKISRIIAWTFS